MLLPGEKLTKSAQNLFDELRSVDHGSMVAMKPASVEPNPSFRTGGGGMHRVTEAGF